MLSRHFLLFIPIVLLLAPSLWADEDDLSKGILEPIQIEQAWLENSFFVFANVDNDFSKGHQISLETQWEAVLTPDWGIELDAPQFLAKQPLFGPSPTALGPLGLSVKRLVYQFGGDEGEWAGVFSLQLGGSYWATPERHFDGSNNGFSLAGLAALRWRHLFFQGNYGYNLNVDNSVFNGWTLNSALGYAFFPGTVLQCEADYQSNLVVDVDDGISSAQWTLVPEIGLQAGDWFFEAGEKLNASPAGVTMLMIETTL
jgi:hypothetical protein